MSTKQQPKRAEPLADTAKKFIHQLSKTIAENDPAKEKAFEESEEKREAEVVKKLREQRARRKKQA